MNSILIVGAVLLLALTFGVCGSQEKWQGKY